MNWNRRGRGDPRKRSANVRRKPKSYAPFRSALEKRIAGRLSEAYDYEPKYGKTKYNVPHVYNPDFVHPLFPNVLIEVKGYFRTSAEAAKYVNVKKCNPNLEIIFVFNNPIKKAHPNCRARRDGTIMTLHEWCIKQEFLFYHEKEMPKELQDGTLTKAWIKSERKKRGYPCLP